MKSFLNIINNILFLILIGISLFVWDIESIAIFLGALVPFLLKKIFYYEVSEEMKSLYYIFFLSAYVLGVIFAWYRKFPWADLWAHFLSGVVMTFVGLFFVKESKILKKENTLFIILFLISFSVLIGFLWESGEYIYDTLFDKDTQWVLKTGVTDTMTDLFISTFGSALICLFYGYFVKKDGKQFLDKIREIL